jgi:hypothetical protein
VGQVVPDADGINGLTLNFDRLYVYPHKNHPALWIYYSVRYENHGSSDLQLTCAGVTDPSVHREWLKEPTTLGFVPADRSYCSANPDSSTTLVPGAVLNVWFLVRHVPSSKALVSLEWQSGESPHVRTAYFKPWKQQLRGLKPPPRGICPHTCS